MTKGLTSARGRSGLASIRGRSGFTLVEVIITLALSVVMLVALTSLFRTFSATYLYQQAFTGTTDSTGAILRAVEGAVLPANAVLASHVFSQGTHTSGAEVLVLELPSTDADGDIVAGQHDYVAFYMSNATVYRLVDIGAGSARRAGLSTLGTMVTSLSFGYDDPDWAEATKVTVDVVASTTLRGEEVASHLTETVRLRNR